jgi:DNA-binding NarL/FixJ family response regulator
VTTLINPIPIPTKALRVFLVEDSQAVRDLIVENLADIPGVIFAGFSDAEADAFQQLSTESYEIVLFDIELKQGNGISLLRSLVGKSTLADTTKIIFSNNVSDAYRRAGKQYGVQYFFDKTSELSKLRALLSDFVLALPHSISAPRS